MNLFDRAKNIILNPSKEWEVIKAETISNSDLFTKYALILAAIPAVCGFIGYSVFTTSYGMFSFRLSFGSSLTWAILNYLLTLGGVYLLAFIIDALAPNFGCPKDLNAALKIVVFAYTPAWVFGVFYLFPVLGIIVLLASIYSLILLYMGLERVKSVPKDKMVAYFIVTIIVAIIVYVIIGVIVNRVVFTSHYLSDF
ncbi:MAG TPA: Yip1 family protein [Ignavibacteriaceae bacterium]|nr:Yip1 family protein [Ignavibacteriaceae bacterium]